VASQLPLSLCNIICTNVPGPQIPLYLMGHKMLSWYPWVPIGGLMGINCAILTYNGTAFFGFTGDVHAAPDLERLEKFVDESFAELRAGADSAAVAEAKPEVRKRERPHAKIPVGHAKTPVAHTKSRVAHAETPSAKKRTIRKRSSKVALKSHPAAPVAASSTPEPEPEKSAGGRSVAPTDSILSLSV
jgi:hypothetical protein